MIIWVEYHFFNNSDIRYIREKYKMLIRIFHTIINRSINIIMDLSYNGNLEDPVLIRCKFKVLSLIKIIT